MARQGERQKCRTAITTCFNDAKKYEANSAANKPPTASQVHAVLLRLEEARLTITPLDNEALNGHAEDQAALDREDQSVQTYEEKYYTAKAILLQLQAAQAGYASGSVINAPATGSTTPQQVPFVVQPKNHIRLPKLELQKFNGRASEWQTFWDQYCVAVHQNPVYTDIDKFLYLRSRLGGSALTSISGLQVTTSNYSEAVRILTERFGNQELAIQEHLAALDSIKTARDLGNITQIRSVFDQLHAHVRSLQNLGVDVQLFGYTLYRTLLRIMPRELLMEFETRTLVGTTNVATDSSSESSDSVALRTDDNVSDSIVSKAKRLLSFCQSQIAAYERICVAQRAETTTEPSQMSSHTGGRHHDRRGSRGRDNNQNRSANHTQQRAGTATTFAASGATNTDNRPSQNDPTRFCIFCNESHDSRTCMRKPLDQRRKITHEKKLCFRCLNNGHRSAVCPNTPPVCEVCQKRHLSIFHDDQWAQNHSTSSVGGAAAVAPRAAPPPQNTTREASTNAANAGQRAAVTLQTAGATLQNPDTHTKLNVRVMFDTGSNSSYISSDAARKLGLQVLRKDQLNISTFSSESGPLSKEVNVVKVDFLSPTGSGQTSAEILEIDSLNCDTAVTLDVDLQNRLKDLGIKLCDPMLVDPQASKSIDLLIGCDLYNRLVTATSERRSVGENLIAQHTLFGWTLLGPVPAASTVNSASVMLVNNALLPPDFETLWALDHLGITPTDNQNTSLSVAEQKALDIVSKSITKVDGKYEVKLPWCGKEESLLDNRQVAENRLNSLQRKLKAKPHALERYEQELAKYVSSDYAEEITSLVPISASGPLPTGPVYNMPHRAVIREDKTTTKMRIVFDCSSKAQDATSLNDHLLAGPNLNPDLVVLLINFRRNPIAITADIKQAFLQIRVHPSDRDALRYLWRDSATNELRVFRMKVVTFGSASSPFLLKFVINHHLDTEGQRYPDTADALKRCLYVDDYIDGCHDVEAAKQRHREANEVMSAGGFELRKWVTNDRELQQWFDKSLPASEIPQTTSDPSLFKVLGLSWHTDSDTLTIDAKNAITFATSSATITKRSVLQISARVYDPLGLIAPFLIRARIFMKALWQKGVGWDEQLPEDLRQEFICWIGELPHLRNISLQRCFAPDPNAEVELHIFCDASLIAYAATVYARVKSATGVSAQLLMCKARVAPTKQHTLPRLELMGALLAARLYRYFQEDVKLPHNAVHFWTDSKIAFHWIRGDPSRWKEFVSNRVQEIQTHTQPAQWRHCPGVCNPADLATRGLGSQEVVVSNFWWHGPEWLCQAEECWPNSALIDAAPTEEADLETKPSPKDCVTFVAHKQPESPLLKLLQRVSKYPRLLRSAAYVLRFIHTRITKTSNKSGPLTAEDIVEAEKLMIRLVQRSDFPQEVAHLQDGKPVEKSSILYQFQPFLDSDGIMRVKGRLEKADLPYDAKHPIILSPQSAFTRLVIEREHGRLLHAGTSTVLANLRQRYFILRGRQVIKSALLRCAICRMLLALPGDQVTAPLPADRVTPAPPFAVSGVDFAGPLFVDYNGERTKSYIALFTCAVTRAVHLELVLGLGASDFIDALRRFAARRGMCLTIYSDNALAFRRANKDLDDLWDTIIHKDVQSYLSNKKIVWKFITPRASWWGGFYERMVRSVKLAIHKTLGKSFVTFLQLQTTLCEVEAVINSRPLTQGSEPEDIPITPSHFLTGDRLTALPPGETQAEIESTAATLIALKHSREKMLQRYWQTWQSEYMLQLRSAHTVPNQRQRPIQVGDVVLVQQDSCKRLLWRKALVVEKHFGRDGKVRSLTVRLANGNKVRRAVQHLYPLEVSLT